MKLPFLPSSTNQGEKVQILATSIPGPKKKKYPRAGFLNS